MVRIILVVIVAAVAALVLWYAGARTLALASESFSAQTLATPPLGRIGWNGTYLRVGGRIRGLTGSDDKAILQLSADAAHRLVAAAGGRTIELGPQRGTLPDDNETMDAFAPDAGDRITFRAEMELVIGLTACSAELSNNWSFKPIALTCSWKASAVSFAGDWLSAIVRSGGPLYMPLLYPAFFM